MVMMVDQSTFPGCLVESRIVGVLSTEFSNGNPEQKLLGVPVREPRFAEYEDVSDLPEHLLKEIEHFFEMFKDLEGSDIGVLGWEGAQEDQKSCSKRQAGRGRTKKKKSLPRLPPELDRFRYALSPWVARSW